ncbi:GMC oxidoreductase [Novosphingobium panipatense]|uniref:Choline dehydrogenase n=1 Tax=Novosphingobium panipatense TaxID=428991 RepID=A0ABY1QX59_9SPHN|nr:GMC family oxidoreductase [Novosphingobium panipatense]SMP80456.1 Choline dehydrogenase [Novosphingobium panipatense]
MITDLRIADTPHGGLHYDVCLIGAGAAGISIAQALAGSRLSIGVLESGGSAFEPDTQSLYEGQVGGHPMTMDTGRCRILGGSTSEWTGRCGKLDRIDFARRNWVPHSGWPIRHADLAHYYRAAEMVCGFATPWVDDAEAARDLEIAAPDDPRLANYLWRYAPIGNRLYRHWGREYRPLLEASSNVEVLLHANVIRWHASGKTGLPQRVEAVTASTLEGRTILVRARAFVLCAGGLESTRLLLSSRDHVEGGLGTGLENAGRFFMQHPRGRIARLETDKRTGLSLQDRYGIFGARQGLQYESGLAMSEQVQRESKLLNASVIFTYEADAASGWEALKSLAYPTAAPPVGRAKALNRLVRDPGSALTNLWRRGWQHRHAAFPVRSINLVIDLEQKPDPDSRVTLSAERDRLGLRKLHVDWRINPEERRTSAHFARILAEHFSRNRTGSLVLEDWLHDTGPIGDELSGTFHHIGTLRMASNPREGVVDGNCQVHGVDNLYVSSCATFTTGGHANPTFTIVALALRLADHLRARLSEQDHPSSAPHKVKRHPGIHIADDSGTAAAICRRRRFRPM